MIQKVYEPYIRALLGTASHDNAYQVLPADEGDEGDTCRVEDEDRERAVERRPRADVVHEVAELLRPAPLHLRTPREAIAKVNSANLQGNDRQM